MIISLFYKEWIKTRKVLLLSIAAFAVFIIYIFINVEQMFRIGGATQVWTDTILKDISILSKIQWLPLLFGILLSLSQFVPEMTNKRLKLTLHLPMPENKIMFIMQSYGLLCLLTLYVFVYVAIIFGMNIYYPSEIILSTIKSSLPWFLSGFAGYLFVTWICIEPVWRQRIFNSLISVYVLTFFMITARPGAFIPFIPYLIVAILAIYSFSFYSMYRFKDGAQ